MRKVFLDNLRWCMVLLLFPYHTFMIYNTFESFYIHGVQIEALSSVLNAIWPFIMPSLFVIAGISAHFALIKRTGREYVKERLHKLLLPMLFGMLLIVPIQTYLAELFHTGSGKYLHYFTKVTDISGYAGGFTPGHLWFLLYLFIISLLALPVMQYHKKRGGKPLFPNVSLAGIVALFLVPLCMSPVLDISGKSIGEYFSLFLIGYFIFSQDRVLDLLEKHRIALGIAFGLGFVFTLIRGMVFYKTYPLASDIFGRLYGWVGILAMLGLAKRYWNTTNKTTAFFSKSSFGVYLFHQSWIVISAYFVFKVTSTPVAQIPLILLMSIPLSFLTDALCRRFQVTRFLFGLKQ